MRRLLFILLLLPCFAQGQSVHITAVADTVCNGLPAYFAATDTGLSPAYYQWTVNGLAIMGADSATFSSSSLSNGDSVVCLLTDSGHSSILAYSNGIVITVLHLPSAGTITGTGSIVCKGATITLSDTVTGGVWSASNNLATVIGGVVTGVTSYQYDESGLPSTDSIYYVVSNGFCSVTTFKIINVEEKQSAGFFLGDDPFDSGPLCVGGSLPIFHGPDTDDDMGANGTMYSTGDHISVSEYYAYGNSVGTDYIYCIATNVCGSDTSGEYVTVYGLPGKPGPIYTSAQSVCVGLTVTLSDTSAGAWRSSNDNASFNWAGLVGNNPGLDTIYYVASNQCGSALVSTIINIIGPAPITGTSSLCNGAETQFSDSISGGIWSCGDTAVISIDQNGMAKSLSAGSIVISYTLPGSGCYTISNVVVFNSYLPWPITGDADFCLSGMTYLSDSTTGGAWTSGNTAVAIVDFIGEVSGMSNGTATITYSLDGCTQTMDVSVIECGNEMKIFPNPGHDEVTIYSSDTSYNTYTFFNAIGQEVAQGSLAGPFTTINVALLMAGYYTIVITGEGEKYVGKFVKD